MDKVERSSARPRDRRATIILSAIDLFSKHGFDPVKISDIGDAAGVSAGAVYRHVSSKQELLDQPIREMVVVGYAVTLIAAERSASPEDALHKMISEMVLVSVDRPQVVSLWHREARRLSSDVRAELVAVRALTVERWVDAITAVRPDISRYTAEFRVRASWGLLNCAPLVTNGLSRRRFLSLLESLVAAVILDPEQQVPEPSELRPAATGNLTTSSRAEEIVLRGAQLFRAQGYQQVGINNIGEAAGIRGPSVYNWFPSKGDLLYEILKRAADAFDTIGVDPSIGDPVRRITEMTDAYISMAMTYQDFIAVHATDRQHLPDERREDIERRRSRRVAIWVDELHGARPTLPNSTTRVLLLATFEMVMAVARSRRYGGSAATEALLRELALAALMCNLVDAPA